MGSVTSKAANGIGSLLGNAFVAPIKAIFGGSCGSVCSGTWDVICFLEHLCVSDLVKVLMVLGLCYITLLFLYLLFKVGICQCIARSMCKMCLAACDTYWFASKYITCFCWHKLINVKRVNRRWHHQRHFRDVEFGYSSSSSECKSSGDDGRKREWIRRRKKDRLRNQRVVPFYNHRSQGFKSSRQSRMSNARKHRREATLFKRRRLR